MVLLPASRRLGCAVIAPARRLTGGVRITPVTRMPWNASAKSTRWMSALAPRVTQEESATASHSRPPSAHTQGSEFGSHLQPSDILTFVNSPEFSTYRSVSSPSQGLLGNDEQLASLAFTHESWMHGMKGHNRRLAFMGRRAMKTYMTLFLYQALSQAAASNASSTDVTYFQELLASPDSIGPLLTRQQLGSTVGRSLGLEKVMRWKSIMHLDPASGTQETGLYAVRGSCVEALLGAIYHYRVREITAD